MPLISWLTSRLPCLILAVTLLIPMTKTHLEHQKIRFRQNKFGNASTPLYGPYTKYDPRDGVTTALILGLTFLFTIAYIAFKYGWQKFKIRFCYPIRHRRNRSKEGGEEEKQLQQQTTLPRLNLEDKCIPIVIQDGSFLSAAGGGNSTDLVAVPPPPTEMDTYAMIISESDSRPRKSKSRSSGTSPEKQALLHKDSQQLLPPAANQVLRTAHWVNTVTNELVSSADEKSSSHKIGDLKKKGGETIRRQSTIEVEINHEEEAVPMTSDIGENLSSKPSGDDTKADLPQHGSGGSSRQLLDLATSEV